MKEGRKRIKLCLPNVKSRAAQEGRGSCLPGARATAHSQGQREVDPAGPTGVGRPDSSPALPPPLPNADLGPTTSQVPSHWDRAEGRRHRVHLSGTSYQTASEHPRGARTVPLLSLPRGRLLTSWEEGPKLLTLASGWCESFF